MIGAFKNIRSILMLASRYGQVTYYYKQLIAHIQEITWFQFHPAYLWSTKRQKLYS